MSSAEQRQAQREQEEREAGERAAVVARNRDLMPETARMVDAWRKRYGPDTRFSHVVEGGQVRGAPLVIDPARCMNAMEWLDYVRTGAVPEGRIDPCSR